MSDNALDDHLNAEIAANTMKSIQDGIDYLTWTFFFRRLLRNPSYYGLGDVTPESVSKFLSTVIEGTVFSLQRSGCVTQEGGNVTPTTLGRIAAYYYLSHKTISIFGSELGESEDDEAYTTPLPFEEVLSLLSSAIEYDELPVRHNEDRINEEIQANARYPPPGTIKHTHTQTHNLTHHSHNLTHHPTTTLITPTTTLITPTTALITPTTTLITPHNHTHHPPQPHSSPLQPHSSLPQVPAKTHTSKRTYSSSITSHTYNYQYQIITQI
jgi:activating signal cointegrator complex subunit 3